MKRSLGILLWLLSMSAVAEAPAFTPTQTRAIEQIIEQHLVSHPELLLKVATVLRDKQIQTVAQTQSRALFLSPLAPTLGNPKAATIIAMFYDYNCSHCKTAEPIVQGMLTAHKDIKLVFKPVPLLSASSLLAAKAVLAAQKLQRFLPLHTALMQERNPLTDAFIFAQANRYKMPADILKKAMESPEIAAELKTSMGVASQLQLPGTPALVIVKHFGTPEARYQVMPGAPTREALERTLQG